MSASQSNLSNPRYGYDFVVATTQESINSGLRQYLGTVPEPETIICFLADDKGNPTVVITLPELLAKTGNISPFDIPNATSYDDPRITALTQARFMVGLRIKLGLPPGILPMNLPPVVILGSSANNVLFNGFCSELQIVENTPGGGFSAAGTWSVWTQPTGQAWYFSSTVNLVTADLDQELNTPYFNSHPAEQQALKEQLTNLDSGAFGLQQLLFDLDNAALESVPKIDGLDPSSNASLILTRSFINVYFAQMQQNGAPVLAVHAVSGDPDPSSLHLTSLERQVGQMVDTNGTVIPNPTPAQVQASTLAFLCATNGNTLPAASSFKWNWVELSDLADQSISGVIAINRNALAAYYRDALDIYASCASLQATTSLVAHPTSVSPDYTLTPGGTPQATFPATGPVVLKFNYECAAGSHDQWGATYGEFNLHTYYTCTVSFSGSTITIVQNLIIYVYFKFDQSIASGNIVNRTITDTYDLSISDEGQIASKQTSKVVDNPDKPDFGWFMDFFTNLQSEIDGIEAFASQVAAIDIMSIPAQDIQSFVFPGGKVFAYKDIRFSDNQDLVSHITYVAPSPKAAIQ